MGAPDPRLGDRLRPVLWKSHSEHQLYLTSILSDVIGLGSAATVSALVPDLHHFSGRGGKDVIPLYRDTDGKMPNVTGGVTDLLQKVLGELVTAEDIFCYCYAILANPGYVNKFSEELTNPPPRIPITKSVALFRKAVILGQKLVWLHTFGERFIPPGISRGVVPQGKARSLRGISTDPDKYPEKFSFQPDRHLLTVGDGEFGPVSKDVWDFSISGLNILDSWLSYRRKSSAGRSSSPLDEIRPERWTGAMEKELLEIIWVLEATLELFPTLDDLLQTIIQGPILTAAELPSPSQTERQAPAREDEESPQIPLELHVEPES